MQAMRDSAEPGMMPDQPSILSIFQHLISSLMLFGGMLAIATGFDPISKEREARSLKALLAYPVYRDEVINGKAFDGVAALAVPLTDGRAGFAGLSDVCDRRAPRSSGFLCYNIPRQARACTYSQRLSMFIYPECIHDIMSTTSVYSIRIDSRIRKMIDELDDPTWQDEVRAFIERSVRRRRKAQLLARAREAHRTLGEGPSAADLIREDRDAR